jgi:hypothetical protein
MTPKERAKDTISAAMAKAEKESIAHGELEAWWNEIEAAIIAAVEEDRASRQCCADEREACAKVAEDMQGEFWDKKMREAATIIMEAIRARGKA